MNEVLSKGEVGRLDCGEHLSYILLASGQWIVFCDGDRVPELEDSLALSYRDSYRGPADGFYGYAILEDLQSQMGGILTLAPVPDFPVDSIF